MPTSSLTRVMFLQAVQDAANKARSDEMSCNRRESLESLMKTSEEPAAAARQQAERQRREPSRLRVPALDHGAAGAFVEPARPWQPGVPSASSVDELRKLKAQFSAWKKDYKARLRKAKTEIIDKERRLLDLNSMSLWPLRTVCTDSAWAKLRYGVGSAYPDHFISVY
jgi:hypothetical protein